MPQIDVKVLKNKLQKLALSSVTPPQGGAWDSLAAIYICVNTYLIAFIVMKPGWNPFIDILVFLSVWFDSIWFDNISTAWLLTMFSGFKFWLGDYDCRDVLWESSDVTRNMFFIRGIKYKQTEMIFILIYS